MPAEMAQAARDLVADWPLPTRQQLAEVATLMRPAVAALNAANSSTVTTLRPRTPVRRAA